MEVGQCYVVAAYLPFHQVALKAAIPEQEHTGSMAVLLTMAAGMVKLRELQELLVEARTH